MLSRRSVRVKVMQLLYSRDRDEVLDCSDLYQSYSSGIEWTYNLFLYNIFLIYKITEVSLKDVEKRKSKHLPSDYDNAFSPKFFENPVIKDIHQNLRLKKEFDRLNFNEIVNADYIDNIYEEFAKEQEYIKFVLTPGSEDQVIDLLLELYRFCRKNEMFNEALEDVYYNWPDDKSVVIGAVKKYLKALPNADKDSFRTFFPQDETVSDFGEKLLNLCCESQGDLMEIIIPVLENWDHERLAIVDTILLQMAICEMLHFQTIPTKVTLNEYVEIAKQYSTAKSKDFINGVLDKLMKDLEQQGKVVKTGRGLLD